MMCSDCKQAGESFRNGNVEAAEELHRACESAPERNCTCQHRTVPNLINLERTTNNG